MRASADGAWHANESEQQGAKTEKKIAGTRQQWLEREKHLSLQKHMGNTLTTWLTKPDKPKEPRSKLIMSARRGRKKSILREWGKKNVCMYIRPLCEESPECDPPIAVCRHPLREVRPPAPVRYARKQVRELVCWGEGRGCVCMRFV